jgi:hypothetical protein
MVDEYREELKEAEERVRREYPDLYKEIVSQRLTTYIDSWRKGEQKKDASPTPQGKREIQIL